MTVLPVVVVLLLVWLGVWSQCRVTVDVTEPVLSSSRSDGEGEGAVLSRSFFQRNQIAIGCFHADLRLTIPTIANAQYSQAGDKWEKPLARRR